MVYRCDSFADNFMRKPDLAKREAILSAARNRFARYGVQKTTMQEIATDAGMSVGTLYLYFQNKDEIIVACALAFELEHKRGIASLLEASDPADQKLRRYILDRFLAAKRTREGSDHASEIARAVIKAVPSRVEDEGRLMIATVVQLLTEGVETGVFQSVKLPDDVEVFMYSIAYFFPIAGKEPVLPLEEGALANVVDWFLDRWKERTVTSKPTRT